MVGWLLDDAHVEINALGDSDATALSYASMYGKCMYMCI